ncbi:MAG: M60 family metallopeptidase, partial [Culicoidibacterales bacterium]
LFTDETKSALNEAYMNEAALTQLSQAVANHPFADQYTTALEDAWILLKRTAAEVVSAQVQAFAHFENEAYSAAFKVPSSNIATITKNAGHYSSRVIANAIDDDLNTYWETNKANTTDWNNEVEVTFHNRETLNRIVFGARPDTKGFATKFEVYASNTTEGDTFELIATGKHNAQTGLIEAKFEAREIKRVKFKFIESVSNWATLSELAFYQADELSDLVENEIFVDKTYVELTHNYSTREALTALQQEVLAHPASDMLLVHIERAFAVLDGTVSQAGLTITATQDGNMNAHAKQTLGMIRAGQDLQSSGVYGLPGEKIIIYVDVDETKEVLPIIGFSQNHAKYQKWLETYQLKPGRNEFIVPEFNIESYQHQVTPGGAIYISNPYTAEEQGRAPKIRIEGGHSFPVYREGADEAAFIEELTAYHAKYTAAQAVGDTSVLNLMEIEGERALLSVTATAGYQVYIDEGQAPSETTDEWKRIMEALFEYHGMDGRSEIHDPKQVKEHVRLMQPHGMMYGSSSHIGIQSGHTASVLRPGLFGSWGIIHEVGHRFDNRYRTWDEVTNNMDAMYLSAISGQMRDRVKYDYVYDKTAVYNDEVAFADGGYFVMLGMIWQLHLANDQYWPLLNSLYREEKPTINNEQDKYNYLVKYSSQVLGVNLTEHFARHGMKVSPEVAAELATAYPGETLKYWYLNTKAYDYQGTGLAEQTTT